MNYLIENVIKIILIETLKNILIYIIFIKE